jgi:alkylation response protein AidB-like acyl-CoA dehydrogenase
MQFVLYELLEIEQHYKALRGDEEVNRELIEAILEGGAKFAENELAPLYRSGDEEGCKFESGEVTTPSGFKEAYQKFVEDGWPSLASPEAHGGQGLPTSLGTFFSEMLGAANWAWAMYPGLSHGAMNTLEAHGTDEQKVTYLSKLVSGEWAGTMCLTEAHCGSDLGTLRTKAEPNPDDSYSITGTKIFISAGEHDLTDNIVHIVLARLPDAPEGTKGISLFVVPKRLPDANGEADEVNNVSCGAIEHKMGINGSATCVMNFDAAKGFLVGPPNKGLSCMFTFMNIARIGTALQGVCSAEASFQGALAYAKDRQSMRALSGVKAPDKAADPIICHPDVRRMLLTQKAFAEGGRALCYYLATLSDAVSLGEEVSPEAKEADDLMAILTPIAKAFLTEVGCEATYLGVQVFGGHGYIREWGMEQLQRDARIATIYEGTTGIQSLDLLGRKVLMTQGQLLMKFTKIIHKYCKATLDNESVNHFVTRLQALNKEWGEVTQIIGMAAMKNREEVGAAAVDYLMYSGYIVLAYFWAQMAEVAQRKLTEGTPDASFYQAKVNTANFYYDRILPRVEMHKLAMLSGSDNLLATDAEHFAFL